MSFTGEKWISWTETNSEVAKSISQSFLLIRVSSLKKNINYRGNNAKEVVFLWCCKYIISKSGLVSNCVQKKCKYWSRSIAKRRLKYAIFSYKFLANQKVKWKDFFQIASYCRAYIIGPSETLQLLWWTNLYATIIQFKPNPYI